MGKKVIEAMRLRLPRPLIETFSESSYKEVIQATKSRLDGQKRSNFTISKSVEMEGG